MRVYFEKPRTTIGWKGLINDPFMDDTHDIVEGLRRARSLLLKINGMGLPAGTEFLDPITPQYMAGLMSWAAIGARTTESQTHREMASGLSMPVGFKNSTDGSLSAALDALEAARARQSFLGINQEGHTCIVRTTGNPWGHIVMRGGPRPNYDPVSIEETLSNLRKRDLPEAIVVDCSHGNSGKKHQGQAFVWRNVIEQRLDGNDSLAFPGKPRKNSFSLPRTINNRQYPVFIWGIIFVRFLKLGPQGPSKIPLCGGQREKAMR